MKRKLLLYGVPLSVVGSSLIGLAARAQSVIPVASSTALISDVAQDGWDAFYQAIPYIFGAVVLIAVVWMGIRWILRALTGRH